MDLYLMQHRRQPKLRIPSAASLSEFRRIAPRRTKTNWFNPSIAHQHYRSSAARRRVRAHHGGRRLGAGCCCWRRWGETGGVRRGDPDCLCGAVEPVGQHGGGGLPREPWIGAIEPERQTFESPLPSPRRTPTGVYVGRETHRGSGSCPLCGAGYLKEGRQGVRAGCRCWAAQDRRDGHDVELNDESDPGIA